jgi:cytochrome b
MIRLIRLYHATLAILAILTYLTGDFELIHIWLGYGLGTVIIFRLLLALSGNMQVGLSRFYPDFEGLKITNIFTHPSVSKTLLFGIATSLIIATLTGIMMDRITGDGGIWEEVHEFFANAMLFFVGAHISYLLLFKRPLAKFMLFVPNKKSN